MGLPQTAQVDRIQGTRAEMGTNKSSATIEN